MKIALMAYWKNSTFGSCFGGLSRMEVFIGDEFVSTCCGLGVGLSSVAFIGVKEVCACCSRHFPDGSDEGSDAAYWRMLDRAVTNGEWGYVGKPGASVNCGMKKEWKVMLDLKSNADVSAFLEFARCCNSSVDKELQKPTTDFWKYVKTEMELMAKNADEKKESKSMGTMQIQMTPSSNNS